MDHTISKIFLFEYMKNQLKEFAGYLRSYNMFGLLLFFLMISSYSIFAQQQSDSVAESIKIAFEKTVSIYDEQIGTNSILFTGSNYYDHNIGVKGHQYFYDDYWEQGKVIYEGNTFDSIFMKYDIYRDLLLLEHFNNDGYLAPIQLYSKKVSSFNLLNHDFIRLEKDTLSKIREGFYDLMYDGVNMKVLVKRRKETVHTNEINTIGEEFIQKDKYFIRKKGSFYQVKKKGSIIKVLEDRKKEIKSFIRKNNFRFKYNPDIQLVEVVKYYESLL